MTVAELIAKLKKFPKDLPVLFRHFSDYAELTEEDIEHASAESQRIKYRDANGYSLYQSWCDGDGPHDFRSAVLLPGN